MSLNDIVQVTISLSASAVVAQGFGVPLIAGSSNHWSDRFRVYTSVAGMEADGYLSTDPEVVAAGVLLSQDNIPASFVVGRRLAAVAQVETFTPTPIDNTHYHVTINGVDYDSGSSGVGATAQHICDLIRAAVTDPTVVGSGTVTAIFTSATPGLGFTAVAGTNLTLVHTTASHGIAEDLADFRAAGAGWYGTGMTSRVKLEIEEAAAWLEANSSVIPAIGVFQTSEASSANTAPDPAGTDLLNVLKHKSYKRTATMWHSADADYVDFGWMGRELPVDPGTDNWALKNIVGVAADVLTDTVKANIIGTDVGLGKNGNVFYQLTANNAITSRGQMASGDWIDVIRFIDFLKANISAALANLLLTTERINFDDAGLRLVGAQVKGELQKAKDAGKVVDFTVNIPRAADIPSGNRATRKLNPPITFSAQLSGALNDAAVAGTVTE